MSLAVRWIVTCVVLSLVFAWAFTLGSGSLSVLAHKPVTARYAFYSDVLPVLQSRCLGCHTPDGPAPMPFGSYENTRPWAQAIKEKILEQGMPPWFAERGFELLAGDGGLSAREIDILADWATGGAPAGRRTLPDVSKKPPSRSAEPSTGFETLVYSVPAGESVAEFSLELQTDRFLAAWRIEPGDAGTFLGATLARGGESLGTWVVGRDESQWPESAGMRLPIGSRLRVEIHRGRFSSDEGGGEPGPTRLRLTLHKTKPPMEVRSALASTPRALPAGSWRILSFFPAPGSGGRLILGSSTAAKIIPVKQSWPLLYKFAEPPLLSDSAQISWEPDGAPGAVWVFYAAAVLRD